MARSRKSGVVDGFNVYKAAQRAAGDGPRTRPAASPPAEPAPADPAAPARIGSHIGRTVLPTKHDVTCYECGHEFQLTGAVKSTFCAKCRTKLSVETVIIDRAWAEDVKTAGTLEIRANGVVESGDLVANHVILAGRVTGGRVRVFRWLELHTAEGFEPGCLEAGRLRIGAKSRLDLPEVRFGQVEVCGSLTSRIAGAGSVKVAAGGRFEGEIEASRLDVEEGGVLTARLAIRPGFAEAAPADPTSEHTS